MADKSMGPVLGFRGIIGGAWSVCALMVAPKPGELTWGVGEESFTLAGRLLKKFNGMEVHLYEWKLPLAAKPQIANYKIGSGPKWSFNVPARGAMPRTAFASCNGFSDPKYAKNLEGREDGWKSLVAQHGANAFHILLMGGDQIYADAMWGEIPELRDWLDIPRAERIAKKVPEELPAALENFYFNLYVKNWAYPRMREAFAQIPTIMMWDDHDIFDGWGSYPENAPEVDCPYYDKIFEKAQSAFRLFQLKIGPKDQPPAHTGGEDFSAFYDLGQFAIAVPDLRSARTPEQVMSPKSADAFFAGLAKCKPDRKKPSHLLVMSSIPVVYPSFSVIESVLGWFPGRQEIEDDLKDHWSSPPHRGERERLVMRLLKFAEANRVRVTILSGDVHVAALGAIESNRSAPGDNSQVINQLISSGIVHPGPPGVVQFFLKHVLDRQEEVAPRVIARTLSFPGTNERFLGGRNWLSITPDEPKKGEGRLWVEWHVEGWDKPFTHVIHRT